jgi:hypothetical protein
MPLIVEKIRSTSFCGSSLARQWQKEFLARPWPLQMNEPR